MIVRVRGFRSGALGVLASTFVVGMTMTPASAVTVSVDVVDFSFNPTSTAQVVGQAVEWRFNIGMPAGSTHTATDTSGLATFDSGFKAPNTTFVFTPGAAGTYSYHCAIHGSMTATLNVRDKVMPASGTVTTSFVVRWATVAVPGLVYDVQVKRPGSAAFAPLVTGTAAQFVQFVPDAGAGVYKFRSLTRRTSSGASSAFSPTKSITVS